MNYSNLYNNVEELLYGLLAYLALYFAPIKEATIIILVLIGFDLVTGIWKAFVAEWRGSIIKTIFSGVIKSRKLRDTISKTAQYSFFIVSIFLLENGVLDVSWGLCKVAIFCVGTIEVISICENLFAISKNELFNTFSTVLKEKFKTLLNIGK